MRPLTLLIENATPFDRYAVALLGEQLGVEFECVPQVRGVADVYYGNDTSVTSVLRIPRVTRYAESSVPGPPAEASCHLLRSCRPFPFDILAAIRFWLADDGN